MAQNILATNNGRFRPGQIHQVLSVTPIAKIPSTTLADSAVNAGAAQGAAMPHSRETASARETASNDHASVL